MGVGYGGRHSRPEITEPVTSGRTFRINNSLNNRFKNGRLSRTKHGTKNRVRHRKSVSVPWPLI